MAASHKGQRLTAFSKSKRSKGGENVKSDAADTHHHTRAGSVSQHSVKVKEARVVKM